MSRTSRNLAATLLARQRMAALKDGPCVDCGGRFPPCAMDFDHRDRTAKVRGVGNLARGRMARLLAEIAKCDLVCANCHRVRTYANKAMVSRARTVRTA